jgi:hypothetical protein
LKKITLFTVFLCLLKFSYAQEAKDSLSMEKKQEIKINLLELLVMPAIGITYEKYLNPASSYGVYGFANFGIDQGYRYEKVELAGFYRLYFQIKRKHKNRGLFTEVFTGLNFGEVEFYNYEIEPYPSYITDYESKTIQEYFGLSMGVSVGYKFINFNNFIFEIFGGAGRYLNNQYINSYPRVGFSVGKRF